MTAMTEWITAPGLTDYAEAVAFMEARAAAIFAGEAEELIWLVEHPPLYTAGTSARADDLLDPRFPVHATGRPKSTRLVTPWPEIPQGTMPA